MKKIVNILLITLLIIFAVAQISTAQGKSELKKISLTYSDHSPPDAGGIIFFKQEYLPRLQKELAKAGYQLDVTFHHSESLYKVTDQVNACEAGLIDITLFSVDYEGERAPLQKIIDMPLMGYNEKSATRIWFELQQSIPEFGAEMASFKELLHFVGMPMMFNVNKKARVPEDFKGFKMQSAGMMADMFKSIGAVPITQNPSDWRTSLENNFIDGIAVGIVGIPMFNLQDVVKYHIQPTGDSLGLTGTSFIMNRQRYESFPPEVRKIIDDNVLWASNQMIQMEMKNIPVQEEVCRKLGNTFLKLTPKEMKKWYDVINPLHTEWIKQMEAMGLPGQKVYDEAKRLAEKYKN